MGKVAELVADNETSKEERAEAFFALAVLATVVRGGCHETSFKKQTQLDVGPKQKKRTCSNRHIT
jgi:hypothetical protein